MEDSNFPQSLKVDLNIAYNEGRETGSTGEYKQLIEVVPTTSSGKVEVFYGDKGRLKRFRGERQPQAFYEYKSNLTLDDWEFTTTIKRQVLDDDQSGGTLKTKVKNFGRAVESSLQMETEEFLRRGVSFVGFDGVGLFSKVHVYKDTNGATHGSNQSNFNIGGSQLDATTVQLMQKHFAQLQSDTQKVLGMKLTHVGVKRGTLNEKTARELNNSQYTVEVSTAKGQFTENLFKGAFNIIAMDYGLGDSEWYAFDLSDPSMLPIKVLSHTISPGFNNLEYSQLLEDSETGFWRNDFAFGVWGRFDWNPGDWRSCVLNGTSNYTYTPADLERDRVHYPNV